MTAVRSEFLNWRPRPDTGSSKTSTGLVNSREQLTMKKAQAIELVKQRLESGQPFFTKEVLQELGEQLKSQRTKGAKVTVRSLTGMIFEGVVNLGHRFPSTTLADPIEREYINLDLAIDYSHAGRLIADLATYGDDDDIPVSDLTPLRVTHEVYLFGKEEEIWDRKLAGHVFEKVRQAWEKSQNCKKFEVILSKVTGHNINNIVGLACGSLSLPDRPQSAFQHALLMTARNWPRKKGLTDKTLSCYMQDPEYTSVDREILDGFGFQTVDDPEGFLKVDEQSIVLSIAPNVPVKHIIADIARPAIVIWLQVKETDTVMLDPDSSRIRKMMEGYIEEELESDGDREVSVYIRKTENESPFKGITR
ncbi:hypothetical protein N7465_005366 [Penicillium sp. CMV-2018d]|nr:hypothetical protein N7465_005366 [Penicillium sp. CMV-2018d]